MTPLKRWDAGWGVASAGGINVNYHIYENTYVSLTRGRLVCKRVEGTQNWLLALLPARRGRFSGAYKSSCDQIAFSHFICVSLLPKCGHTHLCTSTKTAFLRFCSPGLTLETRDMCDRNYERLFPPFGNTIK